MDAERNKRKGPQPREGKAKQMEGLDLESVIERARGHDVEALGEIYRRYVRRVFGLCRYMLDSRERAEDATSEVFLKLQRSIKSYDGSIPFPSWLLRVAGNQTSTITCRPRRWRRKASMRHRWVLSWGRKKGRRCEMPSQACRRTIACRWSCAITAS